MSGPRRWLSAALILTMTGCGDGCGSGGSEESPPTATPRAVPEPPRGPLLEDEGDAWREVLGGFATDDGGFRYAALRASPEGRSLLDVYQIEIASEAAVPAERDAKIAFYINAYNFLVVSSVVREWPVESVMNVEGFFDGRTHRVGGRTLTLNQLETEILRSEELNEPRVHFALNCASASCPPLAPTPYEPDDLDATLAARTRAFVRATTTIDRDAGQATVSRVFEWYAADFERGGGSVRELVAAQLDEADGAFVREPGTTLAYAEYDWSINARQ
ncbi:MAG: DUF547 domain-containing protein [Sandaracinaceae bacterium]